MNWKTLETRVVYDNPWITVREDKVINPGGGENDYGHVHFKKKAIAIVPLDDDGNTWIVGQDRFTLGEYSWEVPMGASESGEEPLETAHRELREETGLAAKKMTSLMRLHTSNSITDEVGFVFVAEDLSEGQTQFDEMEILDIRKLPLHEVVAMIGRGEMTDAISVAAILRVYTDQNINRADTT
jgi:8-oxo-dGTP pyrophosphatase MutT (NUDIX family)